MDRDRLPHVCCCSRDHHPRHHLHPSANSGQAYDPLGRLTAADYSSGESFEYAYDAVGNCLALTETITSTVVTTYTHDAANRLTSAGDVTYTWDDRGNLVSDGTFTYTYTTGNDIYHPLASRVPISSQDPVTGNAAKT
ncbi:MAG: RHS repeat domain-containing protein [Chloroflexota bacterium]|nr:RHS repeat domain-containing protein [Chloroflexota bacterium]